jgi:hypothetical protein
MRTSPCVCSPRTTSRILLGEYMHNEIRSTNRLGRRRSWACLCCCKVPVTSTNQKCEVVYLLYVGEPARRCRCVLSGHDQPRASYCHGPAGRQDVWRHTGSGNGSESFRPHELDSCSWRLLDSNPGRPPRGLRLHQQHAETPLPSPARRTPPTQTQTGC